MSSLGNRISTGLAIFGLTAVGWLTSKAETEPDDNTTLGAPDVSGTILLGGLSEVGMIENGDRDCYKLTNSASTAKPYTVELSVSGVMGSEVAILTVFEADGTTLIGGATTALAGSMNEGSVSLDVSTSDFPVGATIIICIEPVATTLPTPRSYDLSGKYYTKESETNDTPATADVLPIYLENDPPCFGRGIISDGVSSIPDYWKITNAAAHDKLEITFVHSSGSEITRLRILKANGFTEEFNEVTDINNMNIINAEILNPAPGELFFLCVEEGTQTVDVPYLIDVKGVNNPPPAVVAPNNSVAIAALERNCKKIRKKIRKAKTASKKRRLKKALKKCKKKCKKKLKALEG